MKPLKRMGTLLLAVLLLVGAMPLAALAAYATIGTTDEPSSLKGLFQYYSDGSWHTMNTPQHYNTATGEVAYCLEHKGGNPHGTSYSDFDPTEEYPFAVYQGLLAILNNGYPAGGSGGLTADQARYATSNAIRFWLSESQSKYGQDFQQWSFTDLTRSSQYSRPKPGDSTAQAMWNYAMNLLNLARNGGGSTQHTLSASPSTIYMDKAGNNFTGQTRISLTNLNQGYEIDTPSDIQVSGYTGRNGDVLTITAPSYYAGQEVEIILTGKDSSASAYYAWYQPSNSDQAVVLVGNNPENPAITTRLRLIFPDNGRIDLYKRGDGGELLAGATFVVRDSMGRTAGTITTNSSGYGFLDDLDPGTYTVQETSAPAGYLMDATIHNAVVQVGDTVTINAVNVSIKGHIRVKKTNSNPSMGAYSLAGAEFTVQHNGTPVDVIVTDANGEGQSKALPIGTYTVRETKPPHGFVAAPDQTVTLSAQGTTPIVYSDATIPNTPQEGKIRITKTNADPSLGNHSLAGAVFEVRDAQGTLVDTLTTDAAGKAESKSLLLGAYTVTETKAPFGFIVDSTTKNVTLSYGSPTAAIIYGDVSVPEKPQAGQITVKKENARPSLGDYPLQGAIFEIFNDSGTVVDTITTDATGAATSKHLPIGSYTVKEKQAPHGFVLNTQSYPAELVYAEQTVELVYDTLSIQNKPQTGRITIIKRDIETGDQAQGGDSSLSGAVFEILEAATGQVLHTLTAETDTVVSPELPLGEYIVREKTPPPGYTLDTTEYPISITYSGQTVEVNEFEVTVKNWIIRGRFSLVKFAASENSNTSIKQPLKDVEFEITLKSTGELVETLITDEAGYAISGELIYGLYTITETKGIPGFALVAPFDVYIDVDGKIFAYVLEDEAYRSEIEIVKIDAETGEAIPIAGAKFKVKDSAGNWIKQRQLYPTPIEIDEFETAQNGKLTLPSMLPYGTYWLYETQSIHGYLLDENPIEFSVGEDLRLVVVEFPNTPAKGTISINKTGPAFTGTEQVETEFGPITKPVYTDVPLEGVVFEVIAKNDIVTPDGTVRLKAGEVACAITTGADGSAVSDALYLGTYVLKEVQAADGYVLDGEYHPVTLSYKDQHTAIVAATSNIRNKFPNTALKLAKHAEVFDPAEASISLQPGEGFAFGLYAAEKIKGIGSAELQKDALVFVGSTDEQGQLVYTDTLPYGKYYFKELHAPASYIQSNEQYPVALVHTDQETPAITVTANGGDAIRNDLVKGKIQLIKMDARRPSPTLLQKIFGGYDDTPYKLSGAVFEVRNDSLGVLLEITTGDDGVAETPLLPMGTYTITETKAPAGFALLEDPLQVEITGETPEVIEMVVENHPYPISLLKTDPDEKSLAGAGLCIYDAAGTLIHKGITDENGKLTFNMPAAGEYTVKETKSPGGYARSAKEFKVTIAADGTVSGDTTIVNEPTRVVIGKVDADTGAALPGATVQILDKSGKEIIQGVTNDKGEFAVIYLQPGAYTYKEIAAPIGYALNTQVYSFTLDEDGVVTGDMKLLNKKQEVVITKTDLTDKKPVPGATIEIMDVDGKVIYREVTDKNGQIKAMNLKPGKYTFREALAPEGYALNPDSFTFEICADGTVTGDTSFTDERVRVIVQKVDAQTKKTLQGAAFGLHDAAGKLLMTGTTSKGGLVEFSQLKPGTYSIKELEAPKGYLPTGKIITVEVTSTYVNAEPFIMENSSTVVKTGVDGFPWWGYAAMAVGIISFSFALVLNRRRKRP